MSATATATRKRARKDPDLALCQQSGCPLEAEFDIRYAYPRGHKEYGKVVRACRWHTGHMLHHDCEQLVSPIPA